MLKNTWEQIRDLYYGMTPGSRIIAGLLAGVLVLSLVYLLSTGVGGGIKPKEFFLLNGHQFSPSEQRVAIEALGNAGLKDYDWEGYRLKVPAKQSEVYISALSKGKAFPKDAVMTMMESSRSATPFDTKANMEERQISSTQVAISQELRTMFGLDDATVLISQRRVFEQLQQRVVRSASVSVWPKIDEELDTNIRGGIAAIVKNAAGIDDIANITITNKRTGNTYEGTKEWFQGSNGSYLDKQRQAEISWERKIRALYRDIDGLTVSASISLEKYLSREQFDVAHGKPTIGFGDDENYKADSKGSSPAGRPGYEMQINTPLPLRNGAFTSNSEQKVNSSRSRVANVMQGSEGTTTYVPLPPKSLSVSLRVPYQYFKQTWALAHQPAADQEKQEPKQSELDAWVAAQIVKMKEQIIPLIKQENEGLEDAMLEKLVTIEPYHESVPVAPKPLTGMQTSLIWLSNNWKTLGLFGIIAVSLCVLWAATSPSKPEPIVIYEAAELPQSEQAFAKTNAAGEEEEEEEPSINRTLEPFNRSIRSLQEEISDLVAENPDAAASVLRQWIGKVVVQEH